MDQISALAASGLRARMQSLDLVANNIANSATSGYKGDSEFYTLFTSEAANEDAQNPPSTLPMIERPWTDFSQGLLEPTNNQTDLGLSGKAFFVVQGPSGPLYTRNGSFQMSPGGMLVTPEGYPVLQEGGASFQVDHTQPLEVSLDGSVKQRGQSLGQLQLVDFEDTSILAKQGSNYFRNAGSRPPISASGVQVYQGKVEASNVGAAQGAVRLVTLMRQFEMMQKAISISNDMGRQSIEEVAKV